MSEVEWRGRTVPVKSDKARIFLLGLADNEAAIAQVSLLLTYCGINIYHADTTFKTNRSPEPNSHNEVICSCCITRKASCSVTDKTF
ncbi:hypothetical protein XENORESO_018991 [Xenotaenia resolanae]|uniref:Uncharacterized protein n=1 Tax=Xenotaenia resolanae TaxID=208358 RepID=A0ABV0W9I2_9TELE